MFCSIAVLTSAVGSASKLSLVVMFTVSGPAPGSGASDGTRGWTQSAHRILGGEAAENVEFKLTWAQTEFGKCDEVSVNDNLGRSNNRSVPEVNWNVWLNYFFYNS